MLGVVSRERNDNITIFFCVIFVRNSVLARVVCTPFLLECDTFGRHIHLLDEFYTVVTVFLVAIIFNLFGRKKNNHNLKKTDKDEVIRLIIHHVCGVVALCKKVFFIFVEDKTWRDNHTM
jgi:hypothetical protein